MNGNVISPHAIRADLGVPQDTPMLSEELKLALAKMHAEFNVTKVQVRTHEKHGEYWQMTIRVHGAEFLLNMSDPAKDEYGQYRHPEVLAEYEAIKRITDEGAEVGPYLLEWVEWDGGNPFYKLSPATMPDVFGSTSQILLPFEPTTPSTKKDK